MEGQEGPWLCPVRSFGRELNEISKYWNHSNVKLIIYFVQAAAS